LIVASKYLSKFNDINFQTAVNGKDAIFKIEQLFSTQKYFDIILMDCKMSVMEGNEATNLILRMVANQIIPEVAIIAFTANASEEDYTYCFKTGMLGIFRSRS
jgi:two-component system, sensor histidine kinase and response regulator